MSPGRETSRTQSCLEHLRSGSEWALRIQLRAELQLRPHLGRGLGERAELAESLCARQILHAAIRRNDKALGIDESQRVLDSPHDRLDLLDRALVGEVDHADDQGLVTERLKYPEIDLLLRRLQRDLARRCVGQLLQEGISVGPVVDDVGVTEAGVQSSVA